MTNRTHFTLGVQVLLNITMRQHIPCYFYSFLQLCSDERFWKSAEARRKVTDQIRGGAMHILCLPCEKGRYGALENFVGTKLVKPTTHFSEEARNVFKKMLLATLKLLKKIAALLSKYKFLFHLYYKSLVPLIRGNHKIYFSCKPYI